MQVDDCDSKSEPAIPESGRFVNPKRRLSVSERVLRLLERMRFVVPVTRGAAQRGGKSIKTTSELSR